MKRGLTCAALLVAISVAMSGCGSSPSTKNISGAALRASVVLLPPPSRAEGEVWRNENAVEPQTTTLAQLRVVLVEPSEASDLKKLERADFLRFYSTQWSRPANAHGEVVAESVANLFRDAEGAVAGNDAIRSLSRTDPNAVEATDIPPLKLGERGWGFHLTGVDEAFVYGFVLRNTVIFAKMLCQPGKCPPGEHVRQAVAAYASEITRRATR